MHINYLRGFRRLGWVVVGLCVPVVVFVSYQESQEFAGFSKERISDLYPKLSRSIAPKQGIKLVDESGKPLVGPWQKYQERLPDQFTPEEAVTVLMAERNGTVEPTKRDVLAELRSRREFPYGWEVETKQLNKTKFGGLVVLIEGGIVIVIQGGIALLAWIFRGFIKEP